MKKAVLFRWSRKVHKWAGLALSVQLLIWICGGFIMSAMPEEWVHGDNLAKRQHQPSHKSSVYQASIDRLLRGVKQPVEAVYYSSLLGNAAYKVDTAEGALWFDAKTGSPIPPLTEADVRKIAKSDYTGAGELSSLILLQKMPAEIRSRKPLWQARFDDSFGTTLYLSAEDGHLVRVRSDAWRVYDFFFSLHVMEYGRQKGDNNWLMIAASFSALLFALSGMVLFFQVFKKRDFVFGRSTGKRQNNSNKTSVKC